MISKVIYTAPLTLHKDVLTDLEVIHEVDSEAHAKIAALMRQLRADPKLVEKLLDHGFGDGAKETISVNKWIREWKTGKDLWRLKSWELEQHGLKYRLLYVYLPKQARFVVMAIVKRETFDYPRLSISPKTAIVSQPGASRAHPNF